MNNLLLQPTLRPLSTDLGPLAALTLQGDVRPGGPPETGEAPPKGLFGGGLGLLPMVMIFAIFWFVMIGPERKNRKKREEMLANLKKGDEVMTSSGLYAKVVNVQEEVVVLQVADGVRAKYSRAAIQSIVGQDAKPKDKDKEAEAVTADSAG